MLQQFRSEEGILVPTLRPAVALLDLMEVRRYDFHMLCAEQLRQALMDRITVASKAKGEEKQKQLEALLDQCFVGLNLPLVRPIVLHVLKNLETVTERYKKEIMANKELYEVCDIPLRRQIWLDRKDLFEAEIFPLFDEWMASRRKSMFEFNAANGLYTIPGKSEKKVERNCFSSIAKVVRLIDWLIDLVVARLSGCSIDWLIDWLIDVFSWFLMFLRFLISLFLCCLIIFYSISVFISTSIYFQATFAVRSRPWSKWWPTSGTAWRSTASSWNWSNAATFLPAARTTEHSDSTFLSSSMNASPRLSTNPTGSCTSFPTWWMRVWVEIEELQSQMSFGSWLEKRWLSRPLKILSGNNEELDGMRDSWGKSNNESKKRQWTQLPVVQMQIWATRCRKNAVFAFSHMDKMVGFSHLALSFKSTIFSHRCAVVMSTRNAARKSPRSSIRWKRRTFPFFRTLPWFSASRRSLTSTRPAQ